MGPTKPPIEYAAPQPPKSIGRRSRRLRREAFGLLFVTAVWAAAAIGLIACGRPASVLGGNLAVFTPAFAVAALLRYLESRSGE